MYGAQIKRPDGSLWLSPDFTPVNLINRGNIGLAVGSIFQTSIPVSKACFFFVRMGNKSFNAFDQINVNGYHALKLTHTYDNPGYIVVYAFANMVTNPGTHGIAFYNERGEMVYHGGMKPLEAYQVPVGGVTFDNDVGYLAATTPTQTAVFTVPNASVGGNDIFVAHGGAVGNRIYSTARQVARGPGTAGIQYSSSMLVINASKYD